jgi:hypothetical protein
MWVSGIICLLNLSLPDAAWWTPATSDLWEILTGTSFITGAIALAWSEKLLLSEKVRQYRAMESLFRNARVYLEKILAEWQDESTDSDELVEVDPITEIRDTLLDLGREALGENAEWLVLHRARPFEPFLAG